MKLKAILIIYILFFKILFAQNLLTNKNEPVEVTAGKSTYNWEIERIILENTNNIVPIIVQGNIILKANTILYDNKNEIGYAFGSIFYQNNEDKMILTAEEGTYDTKKKEIIVKQNPVLISQKDNTIAKSDIMKIYPDKEYIVLIGNVFISNSNFIIQGDQAILYQKSGQFKVMGNAKAIQDELTLYANKIDIFSKKGKLDNYTALGNVKIIENKEGYIITSGRMDYYKDLGYSKISKNPVITFKEKNIEAYSIIMEKYDKEEKANLLGNVIIIQNNKKAYAKWGEYFIKNKKMILTGNPILIEGQSKFNANKIIIDVEQETMSLVGKGNGFYEYQIK